MRHHCRRGDSRLAHRIRRRGGATARSRPAAVRRRPRRYACSSSRTARPPGSSRQRLGGSPLTRMLAASMRARRRAVATASAAPRTAATPSSSTSLTSRIRPVAVGSPERAASRTAAGSKAARAAPAAENRVAATASAAGSDTFADSLPSPNSQQPGPPTAALSEPRRSSPTVTRSQLHRGVIHRAHRPQVTLRRRQSETARATGAAGRPLMSVTSVARRVRVTRT